MTMHITSPALSTIKTSKRQPKKWKSSEAKKKAANLASDWQTLLEKHKPKVVAKRVPALVTPSRYVDPSRLTKNIPSKDSGGFSTQRVRQVYTGDKMIGIAAMHKSNLVPVFNDESAKDVAKMRRG